MSVNDDFMIQKSVPLLEELRKAHLTMQELKVIEVYLSRIDSHRPDKREIVFNNEDIKNIFGEVSVNWLRTCLNNVISLKVSNLNTEVSTTEQNINLFEMSELEYYDSDNIISFRLKCSESALKYIFNIEELRYLRYKLRNVIYLKSKYSYNLFLWLVNQKCKYKNHEEHLKEALTISIEDLKSLLNIPYDEFKLINKLILKPCMAEINEKTNLKYNYYTIKRSRTVIAIEFDIISWGDIDKLTAQIEKEHILPQVIEQIVTEQPIMTQQPATDSEEPQEEQEEVPEHISFLCESVDNSFTVLEMKLILATISNMDIPPSQFGREIAQFDYLHKKYLQLQITEQQTTIKNRFGYFLKMIENDAESR